MGFYEQLSKSPYSAEGTAFQNRMNGVSNHRFGGLLGVAITNKIANGAADDLYNFFSSLKRPVVDDTEIIDIEKQTSNRAQSTKDFEAFCNNPTKKGALELKEKYENHSDDLIKKRYEVYLPKLKEYLT